MRDGTKYIISVSVGGVTRIPPGESGELIAENIPRAASMYYDAGAEPAYYSDDFREQPRVYTA